MSCSPRNSPFHQDTRVILKKMESVHCDILIGMRQKIIDDLDVNNGIIDPLIVANVLGDEDVNNIKEGKTKEERAEILLDILPSCGSHAFQIFHKALKHHYQWLSNDIDTMLTVRKLQVANLRRSESPPNLPPLSLLNVNRDTKIQQLRNALENIKPGGYLALHGMKGFGRSCLTASTLKDPTLVKTLFANKVYWIKFGYERPIDDEILIQLNFLYHQIKNTDALSTNIHTEPLKDQLMNSLKSHFSCVHNRNALLILDDVWNKKIIDAFDFPCKTLVITTDCDYLEGKEREIIQMKDGFTESESLGLFARVLGVDVKQLPPEAKQIHKECNGMPILIAMFAAHFEEFKDDMQVNQQRWKYYLNSLRSKDPTNRVMEQFLRKEKVIFDMCIDRLRPEIREKYEMLAIFSQDVNIKPETLGILWESDKFVVEEQMIDLCHKCLAAKHWNADLTSYVYGVHDLLLCHLRRKLDSNKLQNLHRAFVEKYRKYCKGDFSKLPDDNYSFSYIGHHLEQANMYEELPRLFLNFDFLREKIYHTGLSDLLIDLKKYRGLIVQGNAEIELKVADLEKFLENRAGTIADQKRRKCLDLIQIGMNSTSRKFVYEKTRELASNDSSKLFVTHQGPNFTLSSGNEIPTEAKIAFFTNDQDKVLIGNDSGQVILWDCKSRIQTSFSDNLPNSPVKKIIISCHDDFFLTLNAQGHIQQYDLREEEDDEEEEEHHRPRLVYSPREKQRYWSNLFGIKASRVKKKFILDNEIITDVALSQKAHRSDRIAACTDNGTIKVWTIDGKMMPYVGKDKGHTFVRIAFSREGSILHAIDDQGAIKWYIEQTDYPELHYSYTSMYNPRLRDVIFFQPIPRNERYLIIVTSTAAISVKWEEVTHKANPNVIEHIHSYAKKSITEVDNLETRFISAALTYDGRYLITSDSKGSVNVWNSGLTGGFEPIATFNGHVTSLDTYWFGEKFHLICGCGKNVIHRWELALEDLPKSVRKPLFDAVMKRWGEENMVAKEVETSIAKETNKSVNAINVYHGDDLVETIEPIEGSIIRLSFDSTGDKLLYATDKQQIMLFNFSTRSTSVLKLKATPGIVTFLTVGGSTLVVCAENDHLTVWFGRVHVFVETGQVLSIFTIGNEYVVTVGRNGTISFWLVRQTNWSLTSRYNSCRENESLSYSSLNSKQNLLALLKVSNELVILEILVNYEASSSSPSTFVTLQYATFVFIHKLTCCEFSKDNNYLAVGLENGEISIFDVNGRYELNRLRVHSNEIRELHWAPESIGAILLSVNCDELAWWNVALLAKDNNNDGTNGGGRFRRSRMGMSRSLSGIDLNTRTQLKLSTSRSMGPEHPLSTISSDLPPPHPPNTQSHYLLNKRAKYPDNKALLSLVPLPPVSNSKVCVSNDFTKFLTVDIHGVVNYFQFYNYHQP